MVLSINGFRPPEPKIIPFNGKIPGLFTGISLMCFIEPGITDPNSKELSSGNSPTPIVADCES